MEMEDEAQQNVQEFAKKRQQLILVGNQKQQLELQKAALNEGLKELNETKETKVYKAIGNILILKDIESIKKELTDLVEQTDLRVKTLVKQEESLVNRLNKLKAGLEGRLTEPENEDDEDDEK